MKNLYFILFSGLISAPLFSQNCEINVSATANEISCGECVTLTAFGQNTALSVLNEDFNTGGFGAGWSGTPGAVNFSNPCSGGGVDGTPHAWMDDNTDVPRSLVSAPYDFSSAAAGVSICFDMLYATQGNSSPCEGPDEPDEGVYLEYSTDGGATWVTINYFDPLGGNNAQLTSWNNYCFDLPLAAITNNTLIRWYQDVGSGQDYDHWGIDNVQIFMNDVTSEVTWIADGANNFPAYSYGVGVGGGDNPTPVCPSSTTTYTAQIETGTGDICTSTITITVNPVIFTTSISASPTTICTSNGECSDITVLAEVEIDPGGPITYENIQPIDYGNGLFGTGAETVNINVQDLNMQTVSPNSITEICIDMLTFEPNFGLEDGVYDLEISIACPDGTEIVLVPDSYAPQGINGGLFGTDQPSYYQNVCFVPVAAQNVNNIGNGNAGALPITGTYQTFTPFNNLNGCTSNGLWELHLDNNNFWGGDGTLTGWSITFDDDPLLGTPNFTWNLPANLSDANSLTPTTCIPGTYIIDIDNGNPGCGTAQETITINGAVGGDASFTTTDFCENTANQATITGDAGGTFDFNPLPADGATINTTNGSITNGIAGTTYSIEYTTSGACNSTSIETVTVFPTFNTTENVIICNNNNIVYPDGTNEIIVANTVHISNLTTINGCDSIITTNVTMAPPINTVTNFNECENSNYIYPDGFNEVITANTSHVSNLIATNGCDSIITTNIVMIPIQTSTENVSICENGNVIYPDGTNAIITSSTSYISTLVSINGCDSLITTNITMNPNYNLSENDVICFGDDYTYPDGTIHNNITVNESYISNFNSIFGCDSIVTTTLTINQLPIINANATQTVICEGETIILNASGGINYVWDNGISNNIAFTPATTTNYTVIGIDGNGCINNTSLLITVNANPIIDFTATPTSGCAPLKIEFINNTVGSINCNWNYGNGITSTFCGTHEILYENSGSFDVSLSVTNNENCSSSLTIPNYIFVLDPPEAIFTTTTNFITVEDTEIEFNNLSINSNSYEWLFGENQATSYEFEPIYEFPAIGNVSYEVILISSNEIGCTDTARTTIQVDDIILYYIPNAFTPDGDEYNQSFKPIFTSGYDPYDYHLIIFNRWGETIFESYNANKGWDGNYGDGNPVADGVYTWRINFKESMSDKKHKEIGHVVLLR